MTRIRSAVARWEGHDSIDSSLSDHSPNQRQGPRCGSRDVKSRRGCVWAGGVPSRGMGGRLWLGRSVWQPRGSRGWAGHETTKMKSNSDRACESHNSMAISFRGVAATQFIITSIPQEDVGSASEHPWACSRLPNLITSSSVNPSINIRNNHQADHSRRSLQISPHVRKRWTE